MSQSVMKRTLNKTCFTTIAGGLLGLGAPVGYIVYSLVFLNPRKLDIVKWTEHVWNIEFLLLIYLTVPTILIFSVFGYVNGKRAERLQRQSQLMEEFLQVAAHDIRTPLGIVSNGVNILLDEIKGPINEGQKQFLTMISDQSEITLELLNELLDIHKMESGEYNLNLQPVDIIATAEKAVRNMRFLTEKRNAVIEVRSDLSLGYEISVDQFRMRQVFRNLLSNAAKYVNEGGHIKFHLFINEKQELEITVFNDGSHLPDDRLNTIFNKFTQSSIRDYNLGFGLGLTICKNVMELHKGRIWAENIKPEGVMFHICFPKQSRD